MKKVFVYGTVVMVLAAVPAWAQQPNSGSQGTAAPAAGSRAQQNADHSFILEAAMSGMMEVELGQVAATKAQSAQVKQFAQRMVTDHGKANAELKTLAQSKNVTLPADGGAQHKAMTDRLSKQSGAAFDRAYMQEMVNGHRKTVDAFRTESKSGKDAEVKAWAAKMLPTLEEHLQMSQSASRDAVGTSGTTSGSGTSGTTGSGTGTTGSGSGTTTGSGSGSGSGSTGGSRGTTGDTARPGSGSGATDGAGSTPGSGTGTTGSGGSGGTGSGSGTTGSGGTGSGTTGSGGTDSGGTGSGGTGSGGTGSGPSGTGGSGSGGGSGAGTPR